jgi:RNA polymerase sigma-70 factor (ECF subfamily)
LKIVQNREDAEEICQDTFMKVYRSISSFKQESSFSTWIYRIAYNTAITFVRKKKQQFISIDEMQLTDISEEGIDAVLHHASKEEQLQCLERALTKLSAEDCGIITLFYLKEKSIEEVSSITQLTVANVKTKLFRIRKKLYILLKEEII